MDMLKGYSGTKKLPFWEILANTAELSCKNKVSKTVVK